MGIAESRNLASALRLNEKVLWKLNRLRTMTPAEIRHRVVQAAHMRAERWGLSRCIVPAPDLSRASNAWIDREARVDRETYCAAADRIVEGVFDLFALQGVKLGNPPRWNRDPKTGTEAPLSFGKQLDYRDPALVGDIKYLWEPNRHLHLVTLAQAHALTGDERYAATLRSHLESWFEACPHRMGANWASALEPALRLLNWSIAWQLLGGLDSPVFRGADGERFRARWLESIFQHAEFVGGHFSRHSSGQQPSRRRGGGALRRGRDLAALGALGALARGRAGHPRARGPAAERARRREPRAGRRLPALHLRPASLSAARGARQWRRISRGLRRPPRAAARIPGLHHGRRRQRADGGRFRRRARGEARPAPDFDRYRALLATGAVLFRRADFKAKAGKLDDKTRWLLGPQAQEVFDRIPTAARLPVRRDFPEGGYYILGDDFETPQEVRLVADAGALGYQAIAAHGHADALSFTLSAGGRELLVDPGTFAYHTEPMWRSYFRGTSAHNTGAHRRPRPVGARRQVHVAAQGQRGLRGMAKR
jgi:hypothetical protein